MSLPEVKSTVVWQGLEVTQITNTATGQTEVYAVNQLNKSQLGVKLAETFQTGSVQTGDSKNNWRFVNEKRYRDLVNNKRTQNNQSKLSDEDFKKEFFLDGAIQLNDNRGNALNDNNNYASTKAAEAFRESAFDANIPNVINPKTKLQVNSQGQKTTEPIEGTQPEPEDEQPPLGPGINQTLETSDAAVAGRNRAGGGTKDQLRYPLNITGPFEYDFIRITAYDYKPSGLDNNYKPDKNIFPGQQYETVVLPMQPQLSETNGVSWSEDQLNPVQKALGNFAIKTIQSKGLKDFGNALGGLRDRAKEALGDPATKQFVAAYFAGQAVGANLVGRTSGMVINPNLELLFNGPNLRQFNFNFSLTPRSPEESEVCRKIIRAFKRNMAVSRSESNLFLRSPRIFKLQYVFKGGKSDHPYLNKFKPCALTNFAVNYTPDGSYSTFDQTGSMTQFNLDMTFSEVMPIYSENIPASETTTTGF